MDARSESAEDQKNSEIHVLNDAVARRIAAGEVIDRPCAVVRELLDNAVDSGAGDITLHIEGGGTDCIRVSDDGRGMSPGDLELCRLPHATSKISSLEDLEKVSTLGFRGEALAGIAACSRLDILSAPREANAHRLVVHGGKKLELKADGGAPGTVVTVRDLFFNMPARRRFLKSGRTETNLSRQIFLEKTLAHPGLSFRFFADGSLKLFLPAGSYTERVKAAWPRLAPGDEWWETRGGGEGFEVVIVHARPELSRGDRRYIHIYANRRRIDEFALIQGVQHAYDAWMPGGAFPMAFIFMEINPALVDFNVHPAKKEARFRDMPALRRCVVDILRERLSAASYRKRSSEGVPEGFQARFEPPEFSGDRRGALAGGALGEPGRPGREESAAFAEAVGAPRNREKVRGKLPRFSPSPMEPGANFRYLGQAMGVFLVAESAGSLFIVDQHAAHEKVLFERFRLAEADSQRLLIPRILELDQAARMRLELRRERLEGMGMAFERGADGEWALTAVPAAACGMENEVAGFIEDGAGDAESFEKELWADLACKAAVKDKMPLDDAGANRLLTDTFALEVPRCPHGRPLWFEVSRNELFELVGRTV